MRIRTPLAVGAVTLAMATAGFVATTTQSASSAAPTKSYAWGLAINGEPKQPYVESTDGSTQTQGESIPENPILSGTPLALTAGDDFASVEVARLTVGDLAGSIPPELQDGLDQLAAELAPLKEACAPIGEGGDQLDEQLISQVQAGLGQVLPAALVPQVGDVEDFCNTILDLDLSALPALAELDTLNVECNGDSGAVTLAGANVLGSAVAIPGEIQPNEKLVKGDFAPLADALQITLNRQTQRPNGAFDVDGVVVELGGGQGEIVLGHTTCGEPLPAARRAPAPQLAPAPEPVRQNVPVTG